MKRKLLLAALCVVGALGMRAQTAPTAGAEVAIGEYYIYNLGSSTYLGKGSSYGTHSIVDGAGTAITVSGSADEWLLHFDGIAADSYMGNAGWIDCANTRDDYSTWSFESVDVAGYTNVYKLKANNGNSYLYWAGGIGRYGNEALVGNLQNTNADYWILIPKATREDKSEASGTNPVDVTYLVADPDFERQNGNDAGKATINWSGDFLVQFSDHEYYFANYIEKWVGYWVQNTGTQVGNNYHLNDFKSYQTLASLPGGKYMLKASATATQQGEDAEEITGAYLYAGSKQTAVSAANNYTVDFISTGDDVEIGFKTVSTTANWVNFDNVRLYFYGTTLLNDATSFTSGNTLSAGSWYYFNVANETEYNITSGTDLTNIVYTTDGTQLTSDANSNVTTNFSSTQTLAAGTYYFKSTSEQTLAFTPNVVPTSITLDKIEVSLTESTTSTTLTATVGEEGAPQTVVWTSSDETVATVSEAGVVTAVLPGTATIRATAYGYNDVYAEATVTVTYPESTVPETYNVNNGATRTVYTLGENLIKNGSFEYANPVYGWTTGTGSVNAMSTNNFSIVTEGAYDGDQYLQATTNAGGADAHSINTSWEIEAGKTYVFSYMMKAAAAGTDNEYIGTSLSNTKGTENGNAKFAGATYGTDWTEVAYVFTNSDSYTYLVFNARWLGDSKSFDNFYLAEVTETTTVGNVAYATAAIPTANIGTGAFQYSQDAIDAANALVQGTATVEDVEAAYDALTTLNVPTAEQVFNIVMGDLTWTNNNNATMLSTKGKAVTYYAGGRSDGGGYTSQFDKEPNTNLAQAFYFTPAEGKNKYTIYQIDADGKERYICTGTVYGGNANQVRTTTEADNAEVFTITATTSEGVYNFTNASNINLGAQDAGLYGTNRNNNLKIVETTKPSITINTTAAGCGTVMLPFAVASLPEGVKAYSCAAINEAKDVLTLEEVTALEANKPYIIKGEWEETLTGDAQGTALTYTEGYLTGVYANTDAPVGSYVLQNLPDKDGVAFYQVAEGEQPTVGANRAYVTLPPSTSANVRALFFPADDEATGIEAIGVLTSGNYDAIYTAGGAKVNSLQKGLNIVVKDGKSYKIFVK